jgi:hypothetical protein
MNAIDRPGTFRGKITDAGVSDTTNGFPQFVADLNAVEFYDEQTGEWVNWTEYGQSLRAYLVLYSKDKKTGEWVELLNAKQLKKSLGWDGVSFVSLAEGNYADTLVMFRVEEEEYKGNKQLKVTWIDDADANPTRQLKKFDTAKLKALDSQFAGVLGTKAPTPSSAPASAKAPAAPPRRGRPPKATPATPASTGTVAPAAPAAPDAPSAAAPAASAPPAQVKGCTKDEAWQEVVTNPRRIAAVTDEKLAEIWLAQMELIGKAEDAFGPMDWAKVRDGTLAKSAEEIPY